MKELCIQAQNPAQLPAVHLRPDGMELRLADGTQLRLALDELKHLECPAADQLRIAWGRDAEGAPASLQLQVGMLRASDLRDAMEAFFGAHAPGHQFSIRDEQGLRAQLPDRCVELFPGEPCTSSGHRGRLDYPRGRGELHTSQGCWTVQIRHSYLLEPPDGADPATAIELHNGLLIDPSGRVLGQCQTPGPMELGLELIDGRSFRWGDLTKPLRCDGEKIGILTSQRLNTLEPIPNHLALCLLLTDLGLRWSDNAAEQQGRPFLHPPEPRSVKLVFFVLAGSGTYLVWVVGGDAYLALLGLTLGGLAVAYLVTVLKLKRTSGWNLQGEEDRPRIHPQRLILYRGALYAALWPPLVAGLAAAFLPGSGSPFLGPALFWHFNLMMIAGLLVRNRTRQKH